MQDQRNKDNLRLGLILGSIALAFLLGFVAKILVLNG